ncbi:hypothetical protein PG994_009642 [Apiospora phragmitis]|uniref:Uncharacterized protein n=1 Tax=Apiospora phragmitis TaxID=2905665 RepID=A0ABR1U908_9PEZI
MALSSLGLLIIGSIPTVIGVAEAIDAQKKQNQQAKERIKFHLTAQFSIDGKSAVQTATVVFKNDKIRHLSVTNIALSGPPGAPCLGLQVQRLLFWVPGPENHQGLVSMASDDPPALHWIYASSETKALRHGPRKDTADQIIGPWNWSEDEEWLVLEGSPYFLAVEEDDGSGWALYYDQAGDLKQALAPRKMAVISLHRELQLGVSSRMVGGKDGKD